jgi:hypothetical protein
MDYGALPSGILEYFQLTIKGNMQTLFQSKQLELLWNYSDVIHHGLTMRNVWFLKHDLSFFKAWNVFTST